MKISHLRYGLFVVAALLAVSAFAGVPVLSPHEALGTLGAISMLPWMLGDTANVSEVVALIEKQGKAWEEFKTANDARLKSIEGKSYAPADLQEKVQKINDDLGAIGKQMLEVEKKAGRPKPGSEAEVADRKAFNIALKTFGLTGDDKGLVEISKKAMQTGSDPDGGYLVLPEIDQAVDRFVPIISAMSRLARSITIGTQVYEKMFKKSGMSMRRVAEGATGGETTEPVFAKIRIEVFPAEVEPWVFNETLEDTFIDLAADLAMEAGISFGEGAGAEFITGNGVGKCFGITSYANVANSAYAWGSVGYITSGKSASFASVAPADKIISLQHALKAQYRPGAVFLMNDATLGVMRQIKDASGQYYLWNPDPLVGFGGRVLGSTVEVDNNMPDIAANAYSVAFGNFQRGYTIVNRSGTTLIRDNITAKGTTKFNFRRRFGGGINNFEAIKLMKFATS